MHDNYQMTLSNNYRCFHCPVSISIPVVSVLYITCSKPLVYVDERMSEWLNKPPCNVHLALFNNLTKHRKNCESCQSEVTLLVAETWTETKLIYKGGFFNWHMTMCIFRIQKVIIENSRGFEKIIFSHFSSWENDFPVVKMFSEAMFLTN